VVIPREIVEEMIRHARAELPNEACGLLASQDTAVVRAYPVRNADESPVNFIMDSQEQLRAMLEIEDLGLELAAIYHSHPRTPAFPSQTDIQLAFFPDVRYIILSLARREQPELRAFRIVDRTVTEEAVDIVVPC
jgi:proteasome lid subunit RPN8/RPN11